MEPAFLASMHAVYKFYVFPKLYGRDLASFSETCKTNHDLVYGEEAFLVKVNRAEFLLRAFFPEPAQKLSRVAIAERAFQLITFSDVHQRIDVIANMALILPQDRAIPSLKRAFNEVQNPFLRMTILESLHPLDPVAARACVWRIEDDLCKTHIYSYLEKDHTRALRCARQIKETIYRDSAYRKIADSFLDTAALEAIQDVEYRASGYIKMAKEKQEHAPRGAVTLILQACEVAKKLGSSAKNDLLLDAVKLLAKLQPEEIKKLLPLCKIALSELDGLSFWKDGDSYRSQYVEVLKTVDVAMGEEIALSGNAKCARCPKKTFWRLISLEEECYKSDRAKADQLLQRATELSAQMKELYDRVLALIRIAQAHLRRKEKARAAVNMEGAKIAARGCADVQKCVGLAHAASLLTHLGEPEEANKLVFEVVQLFTSSERQLSKDVVEMLCVVSRDFPSHAETVTEHIKKGFRFYKNFPSLGDLSINEWDDSITDLVVNYVEQRIARGCISSGVCRDVEKICQINPKKAIAVYKLAIEKAEMWDFHDLACQIVKRSEKIAAGLYLDRYKINSDPDMLVHSAVLAPERALDLLNLAVEKLSQSSPSVSRSSIAIRVIEKLAKPV